MSDHPDQLPSRTFLTIYVVSLFITGSIIMVIVKSLRQQQLHKLLQDLGVAFKKVANTAKELERKVFHLAGLVIPLIYQFLLLHGYSQTFCGYLCWALTVSGVTMDFVRTRVPFVQRNWPLKSILRENEQHQLCGGTYFSIGCTLSIHFFAPVIAMTSIIFLVLGDMTAALIGRSFGRSFCNMGVGPGGRKSVEGSTAMFLMCFVMGCSIFSQVHLREYAVFCASLVATLVELYEPLGINDNITIPVLTSVALTLGFQRTYSCEPERNPLHWYDSYR
eukprot:TRINITY_DN77604_c0_g1_i1.p1 TRINITY_DN77604_c0_g1~~TRINITY_DN77604_c0_g1_i1.p1  ORF type:complete len:277 (+),score=39.83 TRINITY_DN77604_c0_g1_i1:115-945(+)